MPVSAGLYYQVHNQAATLPVVLIHGAGGHHLHWPAEIRRLPGMRVFALDLPGHGNSLGAGQQLVQAYAEAVADWQQGVSLQRAVFVGHSMGGAIALWLALAHPENVLALGLLGASRRLRVNPDLIESLSDAEKFLGVVKQIVRWSYSCRAPESLMAVAYRRLAKTRPSVLYGDFVACDSFDVGGRLEELHCPVLLLCGEEDKMVPARSVRQLAEILPQARLEIIPEAGHMVMLEKPQRVAAILLEFLNGIQIQKSATTF